MSPPDLSSVPTSALIDTLKTCGFDVPKGLPEEIVRRGREAIEPLTALARDDALWTAEAPRDFMAPIHAVYLLGAIGDAASAPVLVEAVRTRDEGDFLTEDAPSILAALEPAAIAPIMKAALDRTLNTYQRNALAKGLYGIGVRHPEHRAEIAAFFARILHDADEEFATLLLDEAARIDDPETQAAVDAAFDEDRVFDAFIDRRGVERIRREPRWSFSNELHDPMTHFDSASLAFMKQNHEHHDGNATTTWWLRAAYCASHATRVSLRARLGGWDPTRRLGVQHRRDGQ